MRGFIWRLVVCLLLCSVLSFSLAALPSHDLLKQQAIEKISSEEMDPQKLSYDVLVELMQLSKESTDAGSRKAYPILQKEYQRRTPPPPYSPGPPPPYRDLTPPREPPPPYQLD